MLAPLAAGAQQPGEPGRFDYWVESIAWSPAWCATHGDDPASRAQCKVAAPFGLILHGLWPQYNDGTWPYNCRGSGRLPQAIADKLTADTPSDDLVRHEWAAHGTCTGMTPADWAATEDRIYRQFRVPAPLADPRQPPKGLDVAGLKALIASANPGIRPDGVALICGRDRSTLSEIRVCLDKSFAGRACDAKEVDSCTGGLRLEAAH